MRQFTRDAQVKQRKREHRMNKQPVVKQSMEPASQARPWGIIIVACLMILFGLAEAVTAFTHHFFGITTASVNIFTYSSVAIGMCYVAAGFLILTMKKWAATLAIVLLCVDIGGRVALTVTGLYPTNSFENTFAIIAGTVIAALFVTSIGWKWKSFR
jgi:hypothetical protein